VLGPGKRSSRRGETVFWIRGGADQSAGGFVEAGDLHKQLTSGGKQLRGVTRRKKWALVVNQRRAVILSGRGQNASGPSGKSTSQTRIHGWGNYKCSDKIIMKGTYERNVS